jgi:hypothetical protein
MIDISKLNEAELIEACPYISILSIQKIDIDTLGYGLSLTFQGWGPVGMAKKDENYMGFLTDFLTLLRNYWAEVKKEIYLLVCTKDRKYSDIRNHFKKKSTTSTTAIVGMLSATVATQIGAAAGLVTPLVALLLYGLLRVGVNSWCNLQKKEFNINTPKKRKRTDVEQKNRGDRD